MKIVVFIAIILLFCFSEAILRFRIYPMAATNFNEWVKYITTKENIFDLMLFLFSYVVFRLAGGLLKALAAFMVIMTGGSLIDKVIFGLNQYLYSDFILAGVGILLAYIVYKKDHGRLQNLVS